MSGSPEVSIRQYRKGDEHAISEIFQRCYSSYSGFAPRTPEFWRWFNLERPGASQGDILIALENGHPVGCLTLRPEGIYDPCYDPQKDGSAIISALLSAARDLAGKKGLESITLNVPADDELMIGACRDLGMRKKKPSRVISTSVTSYNQLLEMLLDGISMPEGCYHITISKRRGINEEYSIDIHQKGFVEVVRSPAGDNCRFRITIDERTMNNVIFNGGPRPSDWLKRRISVAPSLKMPRAHQLLKAIGRNVDIYLPRGGFF